MSFPLQLLCQISAIIIVIIITNVTVNLITIIITITITIIILCGLGSGPILCGPIAVKLVSPLLGDRHLMCSCQPQSYRDVIVLFLLLCPHLMYVLYQPKSYRGQRSIIFFKPYVNNHCD